MEQLKATDGIEGPRSVMPQHHELPKDSVWLSPSAPRLSSKIQSLRTFGHWIVNSYKVAAILVLNTLLLFACFELAATSAVQIRKLFPVPPEPLVGEGDLREKISYYASQDWAARYWHEMRLSRPQRYYPYVGWRRAPFNGKTINIDQHGIRLTPGADCNAKSFKVFTFGGSTMWGTGSPNWGTIPAYLQAGLEKLRHGPVCVVNFGETAYVSTQSVFMLIMQLQSGNVPDLVVFYDGPNDIYAAYQSGRAGVHQNLDQVAAKFERRQNPPSFVEWLKSSSSYSYYIFQSLIGKVTAKSKQDEPARQLVTYETMGVDVKALGHSIVQDYLVNYNIVGALAQKYRFKYFFFWQPIVSVGNKPLTREEQEILDALKSEGALSKLHDAVYQTMAVESSKYPNLYYLGHIFDGYNSLLWIDGNHVTPIGNQLIAQKVLDLIKRRFL